MWVLPMVEARHLKAFAKLCNRCDCGNAVGVEDSISTILLDLPSITGTGYGKLPSILYRKNINFWSNKWPSRYLEGLPDVSLPLIGLNADQIEVLSFHPCAQVPEQGVDKQAVMFSPPLGNFVLMRYQAVCGLGPPIKGFYQLSMVSEDKGGFLFKLRLMDGYKSPLAMEFCTVTMPFPTRRVVSFDGTPSVGLVSTTDHSVEWKIVIGCIGVVEDCWSFVVWNVIGSKILSVYPTVKAPVEFSTQITSGDYILWNTLGRCPSAAVAKVQGMHIDGNSGNIKCKFREQECSLCAIRIHGICVLKYDACWGDGFSISGPPILALVGLNLCS